MPDESKTASGPPAALSAIKAAIATVRAAHPHDRVHLLASSVVEVQSWERAMAVGDGAPLGPGGHGSAGVRVQRWIDLAARIVDVLSDAPIRAATREEVANLGVAPALRSLGDDAPAWLLLSRDRPTSWARLAGALIKASQQVDTVDAQLPVIELETLASTVEQYLAVDGLLIQGRLLPLAALLLQGASPASRRRLVGQVVVPDVPSDAALGRGICALRDAINQAGLLMVAKRQLRMPRPDVTRRRAVVVPDAQAEARVTARQVRDWLGEGVAYEDIAVITPASASYQTLVRGSLTDLGVPSWSTAPSQTLVSTPGGQLAGALARALDTLPGCALCSDGVAGHDCAGSFADVSTIVQLAMPGDVRRALLDAARELNLAAGLQHWRTLVAWHRGDDDALPGVTQRNAEARRAHTHSVEEGKASQDGRVRDLITRLVDLPDDAGESRAALAVLADVLAPSEWPTGVELARRLDLLKGVAESAGKSRLMFTLPTVMTALIDSPASGALTYREIAQPVLEGSWGAPARPGSGVAVLTVQQLHAAHARHVAWCGMVEGLCPPTISPDPLVSGDRAAVQARRDDLDAAADRLRTEVDDLLLTTARVRIGTRTRDVASRWLLTWTGLTSVGGAALLEAANEDPVRQGQAWLPAQGWDVEIVNSSLALAAALPSQAEMTTAAIPGVAEAMLDRLDDWDSDTAMPSDGVLGPYVHDGEAGSWLLARRRPEKPLSASRLRSFTDCPRQFYLSAILGLRADEDPDPLNPIPAKTLGSIAHAALQATFGLLSPASPAERTILLREAITATFTGRLPFVDTGDPAVALTIAQQAEAIVAVIPEGIWSLPDQPLAEQYLTGDIDGLPFEGYLDFCWEGLVVDLKTGKKDAPKYAPQLGIYAELLHQQTHAPVETRMWFAKAGQPNQSGQVDGPTVPTPDVGGAAPHLRDIHAIHAAVDNGLFPAIGSPLDPYLEVCRFCDFTQICDPDSADRWQRISGDPVLAPLADIAAKWGTA